MEVRRLPNDVLEHHGVKGQHWYERRWQNEDGSLTAAGRAHYGYGAHLQKKIDKDYVKRKDNASYEESAKETIKKEKRNNKITGVAAGVGAGLATAKVGSEVAAANSKLWAVKTAAKSLATSVATKTATNIAASKVTSAVTSAIAVCNPMTLAVASSAAITLTGYAIYNHYKNKKLKSLEFEDKLQEKLKNEKN